MESEAYSFDQSELCTMMFEPSLEDRLNYLDCYLQNLQKTDVCVNKIAKILSDAKCWLSDVIHLQNVPLTRAFLIEEESMSEKEAECFVSLETTLSQNKRLKSTFPNVKDPSIDSDSKVSVDLVISTLDVGNAEVILKYGPNRDNRVRYFLKSLMTMATKQLNLKELKIFLKRAVKWNILNDETSTIIELEIFQKENMKAIDVFMKCKIDAHVEKLFKRNIVTALFGNPDVSLVFLKRLKFDVNARGTNDFTALHYAMHNSLYDNVKFLLDCGADPNAMNWRNETPLLLALNEPQLNSIDNDKCAEILLQFGADPFLCNWEGKAFDYCIKSDWTSTSKDLLELSMVYACVYNASGAANLSANNFNALKGIHDVVKQSDYLFSLYVKCKQQIRTLKGDKIRPGIPGIYDNLTMFTILSNTGDQLVRLLDENDRRIITDYIINYKIQNILHPYYLAALKEHMRQFRRLSTLKNRAILVLSENARELEHCHIVLNDIVDFLTTKDLLMFQLASEKSRVVISCEVNESHSIETAP